MRNVRGRRGLKTEHAGAKNGGGFWGKRAQAKAVSRVQRRFDDRVVVDEQLFDMYDWLFVCAACDGCDCDGAYFGTAWCEAV